MADESHSMYKSIWSESAHFCMETIVTPHVSKPHDYINHMFMRR
jgi:hypothetical protein